MSRVFPSVRLSLAAVLPSRSGVLCSETGVGAGSSVWGWVSILNETIRKAVFDEIQNESGTGRAGGRDGV
jgi:hypothetical protein